MGAADLYMATCVLSRGTLDSASAWCSKRDDCSPWYQLDLGEVGNVAGVLLASRAGLGACCLLRSFEQDLGGFVSLMRLRRGLWPMGHKAGKCGVLVSCVLGRFVESFAGSGLSWPILRTQGLKALGQHS